MFGVYKADWPWLIEGEYGVLIAESSPRSPRLIAVTSTEGQAEDIVRSLDTYCNELSGGRDVYSWRAL